MSLLRKVFLFYRPPFNDPATHYPAHPEEIQAWVSAGNVGNHVTHGRYFSKMDEVSLSDRRSFRPEFIKHSPYYRMPTILFRELGIDQDHTISIKSRATNDERLTLRVANIHHTDGGHTYLRLQGVSP